MFMLLHILFKALNKSTIMYIRYIWSVWIVFICILMKIECQQITKDDIDKLIDSTEEEVKTLFEIGAPGTTPLPDGSEASIRPNTFGNKTKVFSNGLVPPDSPAAIRAKFSQAQTPSINQAKIALVAEKIASQFLTSQQVPTKDIPKTLASQNITGTKLDKGCQSTMPIVDTFNPKNDVHGQVPNCVRDIYRSFDGNCNNPVRKEWGKSFANFLRLIPNAAYADGVSTPRKSSVNNQPLPSARTVSRTVILNKRNDKKNDDHVAWSHYFALFGQFLDHDITNTPQFAASTDGRPPLCCDVKPAHQECFPIDTTDDPVFKKFNKTCMEFVRSLPAKNTFCNLAQREQINQVTAFIDGSQIYGSTEEEANRLRDLNTGKLKVTKLGNEDLLKNKGDVPANQCQTNPGGPCDFEAGDERVNMVPSLVSMHTLWLKQHNRLVDELKKQGWTDNEDLYQQARRIIGAQLQHITYNEFLPIVFLKSKTKFKDVDLKNPVPYDILNNPGILNAFATAAFRFGHSMINDVFTLADSNFKPVQPNPNKVSDHFFRPYDLYKSDKLNEYLRGHVVDHSQETNNIMTDQLTNFLFKPAGSSEPALDLAALNIQRGRDHGLPSYLNYREKCKLSRPKSFKELEKIILPECVSLLDKAYSNVEDIDLWVGGLCEDPKDIGAVGPVFGCIIDKQFSKLRRNDRFFYDHRMPPKSGLLSPFTPEQVAEIKKTSLAMVICWNSDFTNIRKQAMLLVGNETVDCSELIKNDTNLEVFRKNEDNPTFKNLPQELKKLVDLLLPSKSTNIKQTDTVKQQQDESSDDY